MILQTSSKRTLCPKPGLQAFSILDAHWHQSALPVSPDSADVLSAMLVSSSRPADSINSLRRDDGKTALSPGLLLQPGFCGLEGWICIS